MSLEQKLAELEERLASADVPRALWPRIIEKEKYRALRRICRDEEDFFRRRDKMLLADEAERKRRGWFTAFLALILMLLQQNERDAQNGALDALRTLRNASRELYKLEWAKVAPEQCQTAAVAIAMAACGRESITPALLEHGMSNGHGSTAALPHAALALEEDAREREAEQRRLAQAQTEEQKEGDEPPEPADLDEKRHGLANPEW